MPVGERFGFQIDGVAGLADGKPDAAFLASQYKQDEFFQIASHFFTRNETGLLGVYADYQNGPAGPVAPFSPIMDDEDSFRLAIEGELYLDRVTFSGIAGYQSDTTNNFFGEIRGAAYLSDNFKVYTGFEYSEIAIGKAGAEFMLADTGMGMLNNSSLWVEGQMGQDNHQALMAGLTFRFGGSDSLIDAERCDYAPTWWSVRSGLSNIAAGNVNGNAIAFGGGSDVRLKHDISEVGVLPNGLKLYRFRYHWSLQAFIGVMAQEVLEIMPDAVITHANGYMAVDYSMIGFQMCKAEEWAWRSRLIADCDMPLAA